MKIIKKINTSAAIALDSNGNEVVVLGKGIGFPKIPYDLEDLSLIERTFYDIDPRCAEAIAHLPQSVLLVSSEICEFAEIELECRLNPNLIVTLADHLDFAIERFKKGIVVPSPLEYDVTHLYPKETKLGHQSLQLLKDNYDIVLPDSEAVNIAMHLINAEVEFGDTHSLVTSIKVIDEIVRILEESNQIEIDKDSYNYSRFVMHIRYLIQRLSSGKQMDKLGSKKMFSTLASEYPNEYNCTIRISNYLKNVWKWECNQDELLYLLIHIHRILQKTNID